MLRNPRLRFPRDATWTWKATWLFGWTISPLVAQLVISGETNVPMTGSGIIACNHNYGVDFTLVGTACPRQMHFMTKAEAFRMHPLIKKYLYELGAFPVERSKRDIGAIRTAVKILRRGRLLGMFPEGTRSKTGQLQQAKLGTARIAIAAKVPVIPTAVIGSHQLFKGFWKPQPRPIIQICFGEPIVWSGADRDEDACAEFTEQIMLGIANLVPPEMQGVYANRGIG